ncbi:uncharacterized protein CCOS01_14772 [Colletotrichum costaricense]|uniref:Uncharacterized protein n=1 Tax=Colletotrichum costaricense TaxID=1209916 RepID=A0AAI9YJ90_9PEZI|nr:uncharacterized protein CCOS01_14772 [Colletotrichum costaricense]KAK1512532.1 hypothetical protein CCOS01_14772 [Colletotrichum costaricense]
MCPQLVLVCTQECGQNAESTQWHGEVPICTMVAQHSPFPFPSVIDYLADVSLCSGCRARSITMGLVWSHQVAMLRVTYPGNDQPPADRYCVSRKEKQAWLMSFYDLPGCHAV